MPQITRDLLVAEITQLIDKKGQRLADLNATLGALDFAQKCLAFIDLPETVAGDAASTLLLEVEAATNVGDPEC